MKTTTMIIRVLAIAGGVLGVLNGYLIALAGSAISLSGDLGLGKSASSAGGLMVLFGLLVFAISLTAVIGAFLESKPLAGAIMLGAPGLLGLIFGLLLLTGALAFWLFTSLCFLGASGLMFVPFLQGKGVSLGVGRKPAASRGGTYMYGAGGQGVNPAAGPGRIPVVNMATPPPVAPPAQGMAPPPSPAAPPVQTVAPQPQNVPATQPGGYCVSCGSQNQPGQKFCTGCGTPLA